ncbi:MAG: putative metal-dependent hydrolase YcfH [Candidatus Bipolaricaulis sibiricus]|uniref:Putative metal-dependent hydrolase YcfH n=1 Tax=Bipolaricaulis sibiricus TaxID=2501609 RepID=A0A410FUT2_BIPS1|nr:MAG: putative metal-dependent hydrolase YcfH [Candidatus Bipolaricaulis sibiricus]
MPLFDTHAHLDFPQFDRDRGRVLAALRAERVAVLNVGADLRSSAASLALARQHPFVFAACGVHPHDARTFTPDAERELSALLRQGAVAVGECGLDFYRNLSPRDAQVAAFRAQLRLAKRLDLPVVLHERAAWDTFLSVLRDEAPLRGVVHAFSGDAGRAGAIADLGLHLGIGGPLTYAQNHALRGAVGSVPLDRIVIETDAPYLPPEPHRGKRNDPGMVRLVAERLAALRGMPVAELAEATWTNACRLLAVAPRFEPPA